MSGKPTTPGGQGGEAPEPGPSREELRQQARAIGERWPIDPSLRAGILRMAVCVLESEEAKPRDKIAAAKVVLVADRVNLEERRLDLVAQRLGDGEGEQVEVDLIEEAARVAAARKARHAAEEPGESP